MFNSTISNNIENIYYKMNTFLLFFFYFFKFFFRRLNADFYNVLNVTNTTHVFYRLNIPGPNIIDLVGRHLLSKFCWLPANFCIRNVQTLTGCLIQIAYLAKMSSKISKLIARSESAVYPVDTPTTIPSLKLELNIHLITGVFQKWKLIITDNVAFSQHYCLALSSSL